MPDPNPAHPAASAADAPSDARADAPATLAVRAADHEIVTTRRFAAPRALVFDAFNDPAHVGAWWGPDGFTTTTFAMDVRPGGAWRFVMHGPDGTDYPNRVDYLEVVRPERLVWDHGDDGGGPPMFRAVVTFADHPDGAQHGTELVMRMRLASAEALAAVRARGAEAGARQNLDRFAAHLRAHLAARLATPPATRPPAPASVPA